MRRSLLVVLVICASVAAAGSVVAAAPRASRPLRVDPHPSIPITFPPAKPGCYNYDGHWSIVPCAKPKFVTRYVPHPAVLPGVTVAHSANGRATSATGPFDVSALTVAPVAGHVGVEKDTTYGNGMFSLQDNVFFEKGKTKYVVQFTYQKFYSSSYGEWIYVGCVWQFIYGSGTYPATCNNKIPSGNLDSLHYDRIEGFAGNDLLTVVVATNNTTGIVASADVIADKFHLGALKLWTDTSGGMLGVGDGSMIEFSSGAEETVSLDAGSCVNDAGFVASYPGLPGVTYSCANDSALSGTMTGTGAESPSKSTFEMYTEESNNLVASPATLATPNSYGAELTYTGTAVCPCAP